MVQDEQRSVDSRNSLDSVPQLRYTPPRGLWRVLDRGRDPLLSREVDSDVTGRRRQPHILPNDDMVLKQLPLNWGMKMNLRDVAEHGSRPLVAETSSEESQ